MGMCNDTWQHKKFLSSNNAHEAMSRSREADEMARGWAAMQQQQHLLAERLRDYEHELDRFPTRERRWALPRYRQRANDLNLSWTSDQ